MSKVRPPTYAFPFIAVAVLLFGPGASMAGAATSVQAVSSSVVRDSAGIEIVENSAPVWNESERWRVDPEPVLHVGVVEGEAPYLFHRVRQAFRIPDGGVVVVEGSPVELRVFDADGRFVRRIGRGGDGPGEFGSAPRVAFVPPDTLVAWDAMSRRRSRFLLDGTLVAEERMTADLGDLDFQPWTNGWEWGMLPSGELLAAGGTWSRRATHGGTVYVDDLGISLALILGLGERTIPLGSYSFNEYLSGSGSGVGSAQNPFTHRTTAVLDSDPGPGRATLSLSASPLWEIREVSMQGDVRRIIRIARARTPITGARLDRHRERIREQAREDARDPAPDLRAFDLIAFPDSAPAIERLLSDGMGTRVVQRWRDLTDQGPNAYEVIDADGRWLGTIEIPTELGRVLEVGSEHLVTEWRNALEVSFVRVYRLERGGG